MHQWIRYFATVSNNGESILKNNTIYCLIECWNLYVCMFKVIFEKYLK